jgi:hypothetical protein
VRSADLRQFTKKLDLPEGFEPPAKLSHEDIEAHVLTRADLDEDVRGINAGIELIQTTRGGGWPTEPVTAEENFADLVWHELEFRERTSFAYVVRDTAGGYLGCCYLYPMGRRTELSEELLGHDVDVSWWVTPEAYEAGYYEKVYAALRRWLADEFPFEKPFYSNREIPDG